MSQPLLGLAKMGSQAGRAECGQQSLGHERAALEPSCAIWT